MTVKFVQTTLAGIQEVVVPTTPAVVTEVVKTEVETKVEEYLELHQKLEEIGGKKLIARMDALRKELQSIANEQFAPEEVAVVKCEVGEVEFSPQSNTRYVSDVNKLLHFLIQKFGQDIAFSVANVNIGDLAKVLSEHEMTDFVDAVPGSRTLKSVRHKE